MLLLGWVSAETHPLVVDVENDWGGEPGSDPHYTIPPLQMKDEQHAALQRAAHRAAEDQRPIVCTFRNVSPMLRRRVDHGCVISSGSAARLPGPLLLVSLVPATSFFGMARTRITN